MKNEKGFTLIEIIVSLAIGSIALFVAGSVLVNTFRLFGVYSDTTLRKRSLDNVVEFFRKELEYSTDAWYVESFDKIPEKLHSGDKWRCMYVEDGRLYWTNDATKQAKQLFATTLEEESFWLKIINECCTSDIAACVLKNINEGIKDENGNEKSPMYMWSSSSKPKHKLMTGADISALIKEAKFRIYPEPKDSNSAIIYNETNMGNAVRNILKEGNYKPYGETNLKDIVKCFLKLHENEFVPAGGNCILDFDCYDTDKRLYIHDPNSAKRWENEYDKVLYYTIVGAINHYSKELRTV